jgi:hypothetical protein
MVFDRSQDIYSLNPPVFDIRFEGIILYDREDGLLRNDLASNILYDRNAHQWRGFTTGFASYGDPQKEERKRIHAKRSWQLTAEGDRSTNPRSNANSLVPRDLSQVKQWRRSDSRQ